MQPYVIRPPSRFDYAWHQPFMACVQELREQQPEQVCIDMSDVDYLDSSAIGMLVLLYKRTLGQSLRLQIVNAQGLTLELLQAASIEQIYELE